MKVGYPCINLSLDCRASRTFRLKSFSRDRFLETVRVNLNCLERMVDYNIENNLLFLRITSDLIPFASHKINQVDWRSEFSGRFEEIGKKINRAEMRITMHPGQYTVLNSNRRTVFKKAVEELTYHTEVLDLLGLDSSAKVNIHVGGVYENKNESMKRFVDRYRGLPEKIKKRLIIENDEKSYSVIDCLNISEKIDIPVTFDNLHHEINNKDEKLEFLLRKVFKTWKRKDGLPIVHYSSQKPGERKGRHNEHIDLDHFKNFLKKMDKFDFDLILEIKDKERSAEKALKVIREIKNLS